MQTLEVMHTEVVCASIGDQPRHIANVTEFTVIIHSVNGLDQLYPPGLRKLHGLVTLFSTLSDLSTSYASTSRKPVNHHIIR